MKENIDAYLLGDLSPEDRLAFEADLASNPELQQELEKAMGTLEAIRLYQMEETRLRLTQFADEKRYTKKWKQRLLGGGIGLLVMLGAGIWWLGTKSESDEKIWETIEVETFIPLCEAARIRGKQISRSPNSVPKHSLLEMDRIASVICKELKTAEATQLKKHIQELENSFKTGEAKEKDLKFHVGMMHSKLGNYDEAKTCFLRVVQIGDSANHFVQAKEILRKLGITSYSLEE